MSYAGLPAGFSVQPAQQKQVAFAGLPQGFEVNHADQAPGWGEALLAAPGAALGEIADTAKGAGQFIASLPEDPLGNKLSRALKAAPGAIAHDIGGMLQYARELSPPDLRGTAPSLGNGAPDAHPWMSLANGNTDPMKDAVATRPLGLAADVASVMGLTGPGRAVLGKGADLMMAGPRKVVRSIADLTPASRAENRLLEAARQSNDPNVIAALLEGNKSPVPGVSFSAAQATQDPGITALERQSRINPNTAPGWANFDAGQNTSMFNALHAIVNPADDGAISAARMTRDDATRAHRMTAEALADQGSLEPGAGREGMNLHADPVREAVAAQLAGRQGAVPGVPKVADYVLKNIATGTEPAGATYEVRKVLADALNKKVGISPSELESSVKSARVSTGVIKSAIDDALDKASGGQWRQYLDAFAANSKDVNSVEALNKIRADLAEKIAGGATDLNGSPRITRAFLKQTIESNSANKYGPTIAPEIKSKLDDILETAQKLEAPQANYRISASGGGSNTASDLALTGATHLAKALGPVGRIAMSVGEKIGGLGEAGGATRIAGILQSPQDAAKAIRTAVAREAQRKAKKSSGVTPATLAGLLMAHRHLTQ